MDAIKTEPKAKGYETGVVKVSNIYTPMITKQFNNVGLDLSPYQKQVVMSTITAINSLLEENHLTVSAVDQSDITSILMRVASLELNPVADPREVYFQMRNKNKGDKSHPNWVKTVEMGIEGDGNDAILARFGRGVKEVFPFWAVREGDDFAYPKHKGLDVTEPEWTESGKGKFVRVVYPILMKDDRVHYYIGEREDVKRNLLAHIANNLMRDSDKYTKLSKLQKLVADKSLDEILDDPEIVSLGKISPAWREPQSREAMILRKMRNNVVKKIPKDFSNAFIAFQYEKSTDDNYENMRREVQEAGNKEEFQPEDSSSKAITHDASKEQQTDSEPQEPAKTDKPVKQTPEEPSQPKPDETPDKPSEDAQEDKDEAPW